jgi:hypothetical protein
MSLCAPKELVREHNDKNSFLPDLTIPLPTPYNNGAFLDSSIRQSGRLLTARFQVRVLVEEPSYLKNHVNPTRRIDVIFYKLTRSCAWISVKRVSCFLPADLPEPIHADSSAGWRRTGLRQWLYRGRIDKPAG